jgi:hypothetical protein
MIREPFNRSAFQPANEGGQLIKYANNNTIGARAQPLWYKNRSSDGRKGFSSFFGYSKRAAERDAYQAAHMTPSGTPGVINLSVCDTNGTPIPFAPFEWNGRELMTDARGMIKYVERDYFQSAISMENERQKYVTQMISLVAGQPSQNVIALFGWEFYTSLAGDPNGPDGDQAKKSQQLYYSYLTTAGIADEVMTQKRYVFYRYSDAECSPEVMCNFGDNDPEWSKAFNKLAMLIEYHPTAIIFDKGTLDPLESSGVIHGDSGHNNPGPPDDFATARITAKSSLPKNVRYPDSNRTADAAP